MASMAMLVTTRGRSTTPRHITVLLGALILGVAFADRNEELNEAAEEQKSSGERRRFNWANQTWQLEMPLNM